MWFVVFLMFAGALACSESSPPAQAKRGPPPPALVELATVEAGDLTDGWTYLGQVEPALKADLAAAVAGHVLAVAVREGDRVRKGQTLLTLDSAKIRAEIAAGKAREQGLVAELEQARRQFARVSKLEYPAISVPERERFELDVARLEAQLATQRADIRRLQVELARHSVRAPFAGVTAERMVDPGAWVGAGQSVLSLVSLDDLEIHVDVSPEMSGRISVGDKVKLRGPQPVWAKIAGIVDALDSATRTMRVRLVPTERPAWLLAGMAVDVEFAVSLSGTGVLVPRDAVIRGPMSTRVIEFVDGTGKPISVEVLATARDKALVRGEGLTAGDQIVVRGNERWRPGQPMRPSPGQGPKQGPNPGPKERPKQTMEKAAEAPKGNK